MPEKPPLGIDEARDGVAEGRRGCGGERGKLRRELAGIPAIVAIEEGKQRRRRSGDTRVAGDGAFPTFATKSRLQGACPT